MNRRLYTLTPCPAIKTIPGDGCFMPAKAKAGRMKASKVMSKLQDYEFIVLEMESNSVYEFMSGALHCVPGKAQSARTGSAIDKSYRIGYRTGPPMFETTQKRYTVIRAAAVFYEHLPPL
uniref:Uncharacterized protein n=1 Tax=Anopheles coluzzii TaxID=1518534 RepID=A0A8W7NZV8_ANOCL